MPHSHHRSCVIHTIWKGSSWSITTNLHILYMSVGAEWQLTFIFKWYTWQFSQDWVFYLLSYVLILFWSSKYSRLEYFCLVGYMHLLGLFHLLIYFLLDICEAWFLRLWKLACLTLPSCLSSHLTKGHYSCVDICRHIGAKDGWISLPSYLSTCMLTCSKTRRNINSPSSVFTTF